MIANNLFQQTELNHQQIEDLARMFLQMQGYEFDEDALIRKYKNPRAKMAVAMAVAAIEYLQPTK